MPVLYVSSDGYFQTARLLIIAIGLLLPLAHLPPNVRVADHAGSTTNLARLHQSFATSSQRSALIGRHHRCSYLSAASRSPGRMCDSDRNTW